MKKSSKRGYIGSTEPAARKVVDQMQTGKKKVAKKKAAKRLDPTKPTARSPAGVQKSPSQGRQSLYEARQRQQSKVQTAKKKQQQRKP